MVVKRFPALSMDFLRHALSPGLRMCIFAKGQWHVHFQTNNRCLCIPSILPPVSYTHLDVYKRQLLSGVDARVPASILKTHKNFTLYADRDSFARVEPAKIVPGGPDMPVALEYTPNPQRI